MAKTSIAWTDQSWNPLRARRLDDGKAGWHCEKVSAGCANCYAETFNSRRLPNGGTGLSYALDKREKVETYLDEKVLGEPLRWKKPRRVFVSSMTDLFGEWVSDKQIDEVFSTMTLSVRHTFQILTKRPGRMRRYLNDEARQEAFLHAVYDPEVASIRRSPHTWPPFNCWLGVSCEDQATADERIPILIDTPAAVRFVSAEPLLGPIDFNAPTKWIGEVAPWIPYRCKIKRVEADGTIHLGEPPAKGSTFGLHGGLKAGDEIMISAKNGGLSWIIIGGESGPSARPCDIAWIRSIVAQCKDAGVPCFVKQLGAKPIETIPCERGGATSREGKASEGLDPGPDWTLVHTPGGSVWRRYHRLSDKKGDDPSEWPEDLRVREFPGEAHAV